MQYGLWNIDAPEMKGGAWPGTFEDIITGINSLNNIDEIKYRKLWQSSGTQQAVTLHCLPALNLSFLL